MASKRWLAGWGMAGLMVLAGPVLAGCGSSSSGPNPATARAQITANWTKFFDGSNHDTKGKLDLLENAAKIGNAYQQALAKGGSAATQTSARVDNVTVLTTKDCQDNLGEKVSCAKVTYDLLVAGTPALSGQIGYAVYDHGVWKVSQVTDCALSHLGGVDCPA